MSEDNSKVKLPPISFLSSHGSDTALPSMASLDAQLPDSDEPATKKAKTESPHHHHHHPHHHHHHHHHKSGPAHIHQGDQVTILPSVHQKDEEKTEKTETTETTENADETEEKIEEKKPEEGETESEPPSKEIESTKETETKEVTKESPEAVTSNGKLKSGKPLLDKTPIVEILEQYFPSRHILGSLVYNPTATWSTIQLDLLIGLKPEHHARFREIKQNYDALDSAPGLEKKYLSAIPPLSPEYINSLLEIKIPYRYIKLFWEDFELGDVKTKRELWGGAGGIYTDDSDILSVLIHQGLFTNTIDLKEWNPKWTTVVSPSNIKYDADDTPLADLSVTVLLLPNLPEYRGFYQNGINSRSWSNGDKHTGLSFAVYNVKWESMGTCLRERAFFKKYQREVQQDLDDNLTEKGWRFSYKLYKTIKEKYLEMEKKADKPEDKSNDKSDGNQDQPKQPVTSV